MVVGGLHLDRDVVVASEDAGDDCSGGRVDPEQHVLVAETSSVGGVEVAGEGVEGEALDVVERDEPDGAVAGTDDGGEGGEDAGGEVDGAELVVFDGEEGVGAGLEGDGFDVPCAGAGADVDLVGGRVGVGEVDGGEEVVSAVAATGVGDQVGDLAGGDRSR